MPNRTSCEDFCNITELCDFTHIATTGTYCTWARGRGVHGHMERRLDTSLCDTRLPELWPHTGCSALPRVVIGHDCSASIVLPGALGLFGFNLRGLSSL